MAIRSFLSREFRRRLESQPESVQALARENFLLRKEDFGHPSLRSKKIGRESWSARVGIHYRAVGQFVAEGFLWEWIGSHAE